jgi:hypothetical protein
MLELCGVTEASSKPLLVWETPALDVLVFRATASGGTAVSDGPASGPNPTTPIPTAPKSNLQCDGGAFAAGTGNSAPSAKGGGGVDKNQICTPS